MRIIMISNEARGATLRAAIVATLVLVAAGAPAQDHRGHHGAGHEDWHEQFYSRLMRKDTRTSCCSLADCTPTQSRTRDGAYEVLVDGEWTRVPAETILAVAAPDGGAHVCFPQQPNGYYPKGTLFCVVLPPEI
jgi:hypothetical protein